MKSRDKYDIFSDIPKEAGRGK